jgi:hypothetical protein
MRRATTSALVAAVLGLLALPGLAAAGETSPYYPNSTISLRLASKPVAGKITTLVASGSNTDGEVSFGLEAFAKVAKEDPTCGATYDEELNTSINEPGERQIYNSASVEGLGNFEVPIKVDFNPVKILVCAYSTYVTDTAANATLSFTVPATAKKKPKQPHHKHRHR